MVTDLKLVTDPLNFTNFTADVLTYNDYYPFGMPMPNRNVEGNYRYGYQGEFAEKEGEMPGVNSFELRLWDSRIGRWLTTDPYGEFFSPYLGMGNNPISMVDPNGGFCEDAQGNQIPCPDGYSQFDGPTDYTGFFEIGSDGNYKFLNSMSVEQLSAVTIYGTNNNNNVQGNIHYQGYLELALFGIENFGGTSDIKLYGAAFTGDMYKTATVKLNLANTAKIGGHIVTAIQLGGDAHKVLTNKGLKQEVAIEGLVANVIIAGVSYSFPIVGLVLTTGQIITNTDTWHKAVHDAKLKEWRKWNFDSPPSDGSVYFKQGTRQ